jgi:hypothetical protein
MKGKEQKSLHKKNNRINADSDEDILHPIGGADYGLKFLNEKKSLVFKLFKKKKEKK